MNATVKRLLDRKRCRYEDCIERHPVARGNEAISCNTCREYLFLPPYKPASRWAAA